MADNFPLTPGSGRNAATREITHSGDTADVQLVQVVHTSGSEGAWTTTDQLTGNGTASGAQRVTLASDSTGVVAATLAAETTKVIGTVNIAAAQAVTANAGTNLNTSALALETGGNLADIKTAVQLLDDSIVADDAAFTVATTKVQVAGFLADDASPDGADEGDAVAARTTLDRKQVVVIGESGANLVKGGGSKTDSTDQSIMAAGGAGTYNYLTWLAVYNSSATNTYVNVKDGSTVVAVIPLPAFGGAVMNLTTPIRATAATAINLAAGTGVTTAYLYGGGYRGL